MTLSTGTKLSHYEITSQIGKGGMGEVYQAKDTKLGRDVAIKVLPQEFARDADRVARFQREAKLLASLNHPNIAAIHGLEEAEGVHFLVMELIEGNTLADRIKSGPIPTEEALKLALQITEALEAAHEKGVIHRDLKPANIKVTPDEKVKVLDFGLAKAFAGDSTDINLSNSPTLSDMATQQGVILGTAAYMSPEQARGKEVDKRADIWAFGVVLFEMLTGKQVFTGDTVSDTLASVLAREPKWESLPQNLHPRIRFLLERCLKKEPNNRCRDVGDNRLDIQEILAEPSKLFLDPGPTPESQAKLVAILPSIAVAVILTAIIFVIAGWYFWPTLPQQPVTKFVVELAGEQETYLGAIALSPDGSRFVYRANNQLYMHSLEEMKTTPVMGTENGADPYFSPGGESIAFSTEKQLKTLSFTGVAPSVLADVGEGGVLGRALVGAWDSQGRIFFGRSGPYDLYQVPNRGGDPEIFAELGSHNDLDFPDALPGGEWVLFTDKETEANWSSANIVAQSTITGKRKLVLKGGHYARYAPTGHPGHLVYAQNGTLFAVGFDADKVEVIGKPVPVVQNVSMGEQTGHAQYDIAANGTLIYVPGFLGSSEFPCTLVWVDRQGKETSLIAEPKLYGDPRISPDGKEVALTVSSGGEESDIWIWNIANDSWRRLTFDEKSAGPLWTPDGENIVFNLRYEGSIYWKAANGTGENKLISSPSKNLMLPYDWAGETKTLITMDVGESGLNIGTLSMEESHTYEPLLDSTDDEAQPNVSPNGRWMAYTSSNETGKKEVYVRSFPDIEKGKWQVTTGGGDSPLWAPNGKELFYRKDDEVHVVPVETGQTFEYEKSKILFSGNYFDWVMTDYQTWDIHPDGDRFLMMKPYKVTSSEEGSSKPKINVILNWFEELKEKVPVD